MTTHANGQEARFELTLGPDAVTVEVDESRHPLEAIQGACYRLLDRCYVYLSRPRPGAVTVRLTPRAAAPAAAVEALGVELAQALVGQTVRVQLAQAAARIREYTTAAALRAATAAPSVDELLAELESEDLLEDPLEIMVPWEQKHGGGATGPAGGGSGAANG